MLHENDPYSCDGILDHLISQNNPKQRHNLTSQMRNVNFHRDPLF